MSSVWWYAQPKEIIKVANFKVSPSPQLRPASAQPPAGGTRCLISSPFPCVEHLLLTHYAASGPSSLKARRAGGRRKLPTCCLLLLLSEPWRRLTLILLVWCLHGLLLLTPISWPRVSPAVILRGKWLPLTHCWSLAGIHVSFALTKSERTGPSIVPLLQSEVVALAKHGLLFFRFLGVGCPTPGRHASELQDAHVKFFRWSHERPLS